MTKTNALPAAAAVLLLLGAACLSTPTKRYFQIVPIDKDAERHPPIDKPLYIEPVRVDPLYDDYRVIYRVSPYELKYYSSSFWAKKPADLFRAAISEYLIRKEGFSRVTLDVLQGDPVLVLRSTVRLVEEIDNPKVWFGRLAMDLEFLDLKSGRVLVRHSFDQRLPLGARKVNFLPAALSGILVDELDAAVRKLADALAAH
ncbi:MAG TPA: ABC-type transport auxiliary lipoprotein family protein [Candidatus Aminicenantes bacterium]|nr:ABC-type transport auxiliary lipoprotein family protein [Candidatus Aminicenantes bacterium]HRY64735.1 ABC-type transport auxiliary lipoprotein family protein [Candidatus Aminicenantes bacterium]HRZ71648.1 ABC-type transport auxiliary lipoprotein family protein [Candidatus Aminicenantes bacterium]